MNTSTHSISTLITDIRACLKDSDLEAARFLRTGLYDSLRYVPAWLSPEEESLLASY